MGFNSGIKQIKENTAIKCICGKYKEATFK